jgi:uncharacterized protein YecT (DUF1311 family)
LKDRNRRRVVSWGVRRAHTSYRGFVVKIGLLALILLATIALPARAQKAFPTACKGDTQLALNECAAARDAAAEAELAKLYRTMQRADSGTTLRLLRESQRAWIRFRDAHCEWVRADWKGGTIQPMYYSLCLERVTRARIRQLRADTADLSAGGGRDYPQ